MINRREPTEENRLKAEYSARYPFALNEWLSSLLVAVCLTAIGDMLPLHGPRLWGFWAALLGALLVVSAASKHAGRLAGYVDGHADGKKSAR